MILWTKITPREMDIMSSDTLVNECADPTQPLTIELPCALVERAQKYSEKSDTSLTHVVIEALDTFLRSQK